MLENAAPEPAGPTRYGVVAGPVAPWGPVAPAAPVDPCGPSNPCAPGEPVAPLGPCGPVGPCGPTGPVTPRGPAGPCAPVAPCGPTGPAFPLRANNAYGAAVIVCLGLSTVNGPLPPPVRTLISSQRAEPVNALAPK